MSKFRASVIAGLSVIGGLLTPSSVNAAACPTGDPGIPISVLATPGSPYTCDLGGFNYLFDDRSGLSELGASSTAALVFETTPAEQKLIFKNLANSSLVDFIYFVTPLTEEALEIKQTFVQTPPGSTPVENLIITVPSFSPGSPTTMPFDVRATFEPDNATLTELTHTMVKTPAPLPLLGAGLTFGFTRKLRRRIAAVS
jgi:hypothetical protein